MASPVERVAVAWNGVFAPMSVNVPGKVEELDTAIADALEAEREMKEAWAALVEEAKDGRLLALYGLKAHKSYATINRHLGGE